MEKTLNLVQRALGNFGEDLNASMQPPRSPLTDAEFRKFLDPIGQVIQSKELRAVIYFGGIEPSLRKVVWKHILNVYPEGMSGRERMDYMKRKAQEYINLRDAWKNIMHNGQNVGDLGTVTCEFNEQFLLFFTISISHIDFLFQLMLLVWFVKMCSELIGITNFMVAQMIIKILRVCSIF